MSTVCTALCWALEGTAVNDFPPLSLKGSQYHGKIGPKHKRYRAIHSTCQMKKYKVLLRGEITRVGQSWRVPGEGTT